MAHPDLRRTTPFQLDDALFIAANREAKEYAYPCRRDVPPILSCPDPRAILRKTRLPISAVDALDPTHDTFESGTLQKSVILLPSEFDLRGRFKKPGLYRTDNFVDLWLDEAAGHLAWSMPSLDEEQSKQQ
jgi:hypothetical protein